MICLTFDIDWMPEFAIEEILLILEKYNLKATLFCTHKLINIKDSTNVELALHPNFFPNSSQGNKEDEILCNLKTWFPNAIGMRTHRLFWYSGLLNKIKKYDLVYDSSLFTPFQQGLKPFNELGITRIPFWWGDNYHLRSNLSLNTIELPFLMEPGIKIFDFHPINIYLNTNDTLYIQNIKSKIHPLNLQTKKNLDIYKVSNDGIGSFFYLLCKFIYYNKIKTYTMKEILNA